MIKSIYDLKDSVQNLRNSGVQKGDSTGFRCLDELYSIKPGTYTIVLGAPTHGKSEVIFEFLLNQAIGYSKKSIILSPETGNAEEITMELIHKYIGKSAYKTSFDPCDDSQFYRALSWVDQHFAIADDEEKSYSFQELITEIQHYERLKGFKFDNIMAEPWNELNHKLALNDNSGRQDLAIEEELTFLRRYCKNENKHAFLSFHPSFQTLVTDPHSKVKYYEMPRAREAAGGQATLRKAFSWINIWRPPLGVADVNGIPYLDNELFIQIEKSKPKGVGKKGSTSLYFNFARNRYYEKINNQNSYAFDHKKEIELEDTVTSLQPNINFNTNNDDDTPF